jgi:hypothetical protein
VSIILSFSSNSHALYRINNLYKKIGIPVVKNTFPIIFKSLIMNPIFWGDINLKSTIGASGLEISINSLKAHIDYGDIEKLADFLNQIRKTKPDYVNGVILNLRPCENLNVIYKNKHVIFSIEKYFNTTNYVFEVWQIKDIEKVLEKSMRL